MKIIKTENIPIYSWASSLDEKTLNQAKNLANLPLAFSHIAIMPDAHVGYGMPIGAIMASNEAVVPNAVGVDIGCGVSLLKIKTKELSRDNLYKIKEQIEKTVPLGFNRHKQPVADSLMPDKEQGEIVKKHYSLAKKQLGTLGGGNHFIEIQKDDELNYYLMVHSGSRNLGKQVADYYNQVAIKNKKRYSSKINDSWQLDYLPLNSKEAKNYIQEMNYCREFAYLNRQYILKQVIESIKKVLNQEIVVEDKIDIAHNYASFENHYNTKLLVHRKGAILASYGTLALIPGSQGSASYIVKGQGRAESFNSSSHGAGRSLSRKQAIKNLDLKQETDKLREKQIIHSIRSQKDLDEACGAYKDIDEIIENQSDLTEKIKKLYPLMVVKG